MQSVSRLRNNLLLIVIFALIFSFIPIASAVEKAPNFILKTDTSVVKLSSYKGRLVYVDFWASWCTPCLKSFPWMNDLQERYGKQGLTVIAINLDQDQALAKQFLSKVSVNFTIGYDPKGTIAEAYKVAAMPSSYLIDPQGFIIMEKKGFKIEEKQASEAKIAELLGKYKVGKNAE